MAPVPTPGVPPPDHPWTLWAVLFVLVSGTLGFLGNALSSRARAERLLDERVRAIREEFADRERSSRREFKAHLNRLDDMLMESIRREKELRAENVRLLVRVAALEALVQASGCPLAQEQAARMQAEASRLEGGTPNNDKENDGA